VDFATATISVNFLTTPWFGPDNYREPTSDKWNKVAVNDELQITPRN